MKLASLKAGGRDGTLVVVSRDLRRVAAVPHIAATLQRALENWTECAPLLARAYEDLNAGLTADASDFDAAVVAAPLPRAYQWLDGSAYLHHAELLRRMRNVEMPQSLYRDPLMYQGGSDSFAAPLDPIIAADEAWGIDFEAEVAVIVDDVPMGIGRDDARSHIKLVMIANDVSLRNLLVEEIKKGLGFVQSKPATAFSPVAVTPEELGSAWDGDKVSLPLVSRVNERTIGHPNAGRDMYFDFPSLIVHAAATRDLEAGTVIGAGTVSNRDRTTGSSCLAEVRMLETLSSGAVTTEYLRHGDRVRIEMLNDRGDSVFGVIDQLVRAHN
jgi:fumarylacetoacetate (FAA) hydrolase